jgi:serine/threonine protein kinase
MATCPILKPLASATMAKGRVQGAAELVGSRLYYTVHPHGSVPETHIITRPIHGGDDVSIVVAQPVTVDDATTGAVRTQSGIVQQVSPQGLAHVNGRDLRQGETAQAYLARDTWSLADPASGAVQALHRDGHNYELTAEPRAGTALASILGTYNMPQKDVWLRIIEPPAHPTREDEQRLERLVEGLMLQAAEPREPLFASALAVCHDPVPFALLKRYRHGSLLDKVQHDHAGVLERWPAIWTQLREIGEALRRRNVAHHNIKLDNVLLKSWDPVELKLADFDQATVLDPSVEQVHYGRGSSGTRIDPPPEISLQYGATHMLRGGSWPVHAADAWSLGMVGFAAYTGTFAAPGQDWRAALAAVGASNANYHELAQYLEAVRAGS